MLTNINLLTPNHMTSLILCLNFTINLKVFLMLFFFFTDTSGNCRCNTRSNSKLSLCVTHSRFIRRRVWEMILCLTCFQVFTPLCISHNQIRSNGNFPCSHALKKTNQCLTYTSTELKVVWNISHFLGQSLSIFLDVIRKVYQLSVLCHM